MWWVLVGSVVREVAYLSKVFDAGMNDVLPKPFTKEMLFDMLDVGPSLPSFWNLTD